MSRRLAGIWWAVPTGALPSWSVRLPGTGPEPVVIASTAAICPPSNASPMGVGSGQ